MKKTVKHAGYPDHDLVYFEWFFTNWCNYACSYCSAEGMMAESFSKKDSPSKYKLTLAKFKNIEQPFLIELLGGEPTLHPHIKEVLIELNSIEKCQRVEVVTNLSRPIKFFENLDIPELDQVLITASYHPEYYSEKFMEKAIAITNMKHLKFNVNINLPDDKEEWPRVLQLVEEFKKNNVTYGFNFLFETPNYTPNYTPEFFETFNPYIKNKQRYYSMTFDDGETRDVGESEIIEKGYNKFEGYVCRPAMYRILMDGTIVNICTNRILKIRMTKEELLKEDVCISKNCSCDMMHAFYKRKI
jgi:organic radical activating enzyme